MASVQELLLALDARRKPNPLASVLENTLGGIGQQLNPSPVDRSSIALRLAQQRQADEKRQRDSRLEIEEQKRFVEKQKKDTLREKERQENISRMDKKVKSGAATEEVKVSGSDFTRTFTPKDLTATDFIGVDQLAAIQSGDPELIKKNFPLGVPQKLFTAALKEGVRVTKEKGKAKTRQENIAIAGNTVVQDINRGIQVLEKNMQGVVGTASGAIGALLKFIPGRDAFELERFSESVKSNISIDRLQAMREASPTGGALGQIPVQQQKFLMQLLGSLEVSQRSDILLDNMKRIFNIYNDLIHGQGNGPKDGFRYDLSFDEQGFPVEGGAKWPGTSSLVGPELPTGSIDLGGGISFEEIP